MREEMRREGERRKAIESESLGVESGNLSFNDTRQCFLHLLALHHCLFDGY